MNASIALRSREFALDLHALLGQLDPSRESSGRLLSAAETLGPRIAALRERLGEMLAGWPQQTASALRGSFESLRALLEAAPTENARELWAAFRARLQRGYEDLARLLSTLEIHVPSLRPTNYARMTFHVLAGLVALLTIQHLLTPSGLRWVAGAFFVSGWTMELVRRHSPGLNQLLMQIFGRVAHPHEHHRVNSATWYSTALFVLSLWQSPLVCALAVVILGFGDPAAALIGRRFGRTKLTQGRSLEGTLAFVVAATLASFVVLRVYYPELSGPLGLALALLPAVAGALAELLAFRVDDNLIIPLSAAGMASLTLLAFGG